LFGRQSSVWSLPSRSMSLPLLCPPEVDNHSSARPAGIRLTGASDQWCQAQETSCPLICLQLPGASGSPTSNDCDPVSDPGWSRRNLEVLTRLIRSKPWTSTAFVATASPRTRRNIRKRYPTSSAPRQTRNVSTTAMASPAAKVPAPRTTRVELKIPCGPIKHRHQRRRQGREPQAL
jgi:hypothetical protein